MQEKYQKLIIGKLSNELSEKENNLFNKEISGNKEFKKEYESTLDIWNSLSEIKKADYDSVRILKLISHKISMNKKNRKSRIIYTTTKYAAIFIGLLIISVSLYKDLNNVKVIVNNTVAIKKVTLPDNSVITLNKNSELKYNNSVIKGFDREVSLKGEAFFEITKQNGKQFTVHTSDFDINVLGTKFNVRTYEKNQSVVLTEGKIRLNNFQNSETDIVLKSGEIVKYNFEKNIFLKEKINTAIYTSWLKNRLEFDNFSLNELAELLKLRYNKILIINNKEAQFVNISGSAPSDDVYLIVKALQSMFNTEITEKNDTIIIN